MSHAPVKRLSVLFVNYNSWRLCVGAVESLRRHPPHDVEGHPLPYEVIVVDNNSPIKDPDAEADLQELLSAGPFDGRIIMHHENGGYGKGMNLAFERATGDAVLVCNPDLMFLPNCIDSLLRYLELRPDVGAVQPRSYWDSDLEGHFPPNILPTMGDLLALFAASLSPRMVRRYSMVRTRTALKIWRAEKDVKLSMLCGCCFLMRRSAIEEVGLFDERFPLYYEDTDLSVRLHKAGYDIVQVEGANLVHYYNRSAITEVELSVERYFISRRVFYRKWYGRFGQFVYDVIRKIQTSSWGKRRDDLCPQKVIHDLGAQTGPPVIEFDREYEKILVEVAHDPNFYLAGGMFGHGRRWTVGPELFKSFGPTTYYFRVMDVSSSVAQLVGVWRYELISPPPTESAQVTEEAKLG